MKPPYLVFIGDESSPSNLKTALGIKHWRPELCIGQFRSSNSAFDLGLPELNFSEAKARGANTLVIGVAPVGGRVKDSWIPLIIEAIDSGLNIASGLHDYLSNYLDIQSKANEKGVQLFDIRKPPINLPTGNGVKRTGKRLLTVGTDCAVGKKFTALQVQQAMQQAGFNCTFRATGQTGILISGKGIAIDAVVADYISGAAETLSPNNLANHWDIIEGQGTILHPAYSGVSLGLLHGSQPDEMILCHDANRQFMEDLDNFPIHDLSVYIDAYLSAAKVTNPKPSFCGIAVNTSGLNDSETKRLFDNIQSTYNLPCCDPVKTGVTPIVDSLKQKYAHA